MSDDPTKPDPTEPQPAAAATPPPATPPAETWDEERAKATILAQRESEKQLKAELAEAKKAQTRLAEIEQAQMSEQERAIAERDTAKAEAAKAADTLRQAYLLVELSKPEHGIVDAEAAAALISGVEFGDDGRPTNAQDRIGALLEAKGFLKSVPTAVTPAVPKINSGSGTSPAAAPNLAPEEVAMAERLNMSPEKYAALKEVRSAADYQKLTAAQPQT